MALCQLLSSGPHIPSVGLGVGSIKDPVQLKVAFGTALEVGYRHVDTAYVYQNEEFVGNVLKEWFSTGKLKRDDMFVTTKLPIMSDNPNTVEDYLKTSLSRLQLEYVDLYLIHWPVTGKKDELTGELHQHETDHAAIWQKMEEQVDAGRTKSIGLSNFNAEQVEGVYQGAKIKPACLQIKIDIYDQQLELVDFCRKKNIVLTGYSSLRQSETEVPNVLENPVILNIAKRYGKSSAQVILRYFVQQNIVMIPRSVTPSRIKENFDVFNFSLTEDDMKAIRNLNMANRK